jgi:uncharacterized protein YjdB
MSSLPLRLGSKGGNATVKFTGAIVVVVLGTACHPVKSVTIEPNSVTLRTRGATATLKATAKDERGVIVADVQVEWASSAPAVASVLAGTVTALHSGETAVSAKAEGVGATASVVVNIPAGVELTPKRIDVDGVGKSVALNAVVKDENGKPVANEPVEWSTSDPKVVQVSGGRVTSTGPGTATISVSARDFKDQATVQVVLPPPASVSVEPAQHTFEKAGEMFQVTAKALDDKGNPIAGATVEWSSSDPAVATVAPSGMVTAVKKGKAKVTAKSADKSAEVEVVVK